MNLPFTRGIGQPFLSTKIDDRDRLGDDGIMGPPEPTLGSILATRRKPRQLAAPDANAEMFVSFVPLHSTLCFCGPCRARHSTGSFPLTQFSCQSLIRSLIRCRTKPDFGRNILRVSKRVGQQGTTPVGEREMRTMATTAPLSMGFPKSKHVVCGTCFGRGLDPHISGISQSASDHRGFVASSSDAFTCVHLDIHPDVPVFG